MSDQVWVKEGWVKSEFEQAYGKSRNYQCGLWEVRSISESYWSRMEPNGHGYGKTISGTHYEVRFDGKVILDSFACDRFANVREVRAHIQSFDSKVGSKVSEDAEEVRSRFVEVQR